MRTAPVAFTLRSHPFNTNDVNDLYNELVEVLRDVILCVGAKDDPGALGSILSFLGVTEAQGRGGLHLHGNGWCKVTADDITRHAADDSTMKYIYELVDSLVTGEVDP